MADNGNRNFLIVLFAAIFGYSIGKAIENSRQGDGELSTSAEGQAEIEKLRQVIDEELLDGVSEDDVLSGIIIYGNRQLGSGMTGAHIDSIRKVVRAEKVRLQKEGKI